MLFASRLAALVALTLPLSCGGEDARYPSLLPTEQILAEPTLPDHAGAAAADPAPVDIEARAEALRRRAEALRGPVIEPEARARMTAARD